MSSSTPEPESFLNVMAQFLSAGRQVEAEGDQVVFTPSSEPLTELQRHFLDCGKALTRALAKEFEEAIARGEVPTGPCYVCGKLATSQCDYEYNTGHKCNRWICDNHSVIEAQHWDKHGLDGVDVRCHEHRNLGCLPAPRWEGQGNGLLTAY
jgi:hypothetical protein